MSEIFFSVFIEFAEEVSDEIELFDFLLEYFALGFSENFSDSKNFVEKNEKNFDTICEVK